MKKMHSSTNLAIAVSTAVLTLGAAIPARADVSVGGANGWDVSFGGMINAFAVSADWDVGNDKERTTRIMSGFNPSKFNAHFKAPRYEGLDISGHFQFAPSIQSNKSKFSGNSAEVRVLDLNIGGSFGTFAIGRGWGIFNNQAVINDGGSGLGIGRIPSADRGGATPGRIGTGYTYPDFTARIAYTTPSVGGFQLSAGLFDPIETPFGSGLLPANNGGTGVGSLETRTPRAEIEATFAQDFSGGSYKVWTGALYQSIKDKGTGSSTRITGVDLGAHVGVGGLGLTAAYTPRTKGVGVDGFQGNGFTCDVAGCRAAKADFWYGEIDYTFGKTTFGASTGKGHQDAESGFDKVVNNLDMLFARYKLAPQLTLMLELQQFKQRTTGVITEKYQAFAVGAQFDF